MGWKEFCRGIAFSQVFVFFTTSVSTFYINISWKHRCKAWLPCQWSLKCLLCSIIWTLRSDGSILFVSEIFNCRMKRDAKFEIFTSPRSQMFFEFFPLVPPLGKKLSKKGWNFVIFQKILNPAFAENCSCQKLVNPLFYISSHFLFGIPFRTFIIFLKTP